MCGILPPFRGPEISRHPRRASRGSSDRLLQPQALAWLGHAGSGLPGRAAKPEETVQKTIGHSCFMSADGFTRAPQPSRARSGIRRWPVPTSCVRGSGLHPAVRSASRGRSASRMVRSHAGVLIAPFVAPRPRVAARSPRSGEAWQRGRRALRCGMLAGLRQLPAGRVLRPANGGTLSSPA